MRTSARSFVMAMPPNSLERDREAIRARRRLERHSKAAGLNAPFAIVIGAVIIGLAILGSTLLAPYRLAASAEVAWRINTVTGDVQMCNYGVGRCLKLDERP